MTGSDAWESGRPRHPSGSGVLGSSCMQQYFPSMSSLKVSYATALLISRESAWSAWLMAMEAEASRALESDDDEERGRSSAAASELGNLKSRDPRPAKHRQLHRGSRATTGVTCNYTREIPVLKRASIPKATLACIDPPQNGPTSIAASSSLDGRREMRIGCGSDRLNLILRTQTLS